MIVNTYLHVPLATSEGAVWAHHNHDGPKAAGVHKILGISLRVCIKVCICSTKPQRILCGPPTAICIVVSHSKSGQLSIRVVQPASESERLETGVRISQHNAELIV